MTAGSRGVFLDRDGVLNEIVFHGSEPGSPRSLDQLRLAPDVPEAVRRLKAAGLHLICVTNQPDVAQGHISPAELEAVNAELRHRLPEIEDIIVCPHVDGDRCDCRKPLPGMLREGAQRFGLDLGASFMVGDRWRDVEAGAAAGCRTVMVESAHIDRAPAIAPDLTCSSLAEAATWILEQIGAAQEACS